MAHEHQLLRERAEQVRRVQAVGIALLPLREHLTLTLASAEEEYAAARVQTRQLRHHCLHLVGGVYLPGVRGKRSYAYPLLQHLAQTDLLRQEPQVTALGREYRPELQPYCVAQPSQHVGVAVKRRW